MLPGAAPPSSPRKRYSRIPEVLPIPDLIELQRDSFRWFIEDGLRELFDEISPIQDFTGKVMELHFKDYEFGEPKYSELECRTRDLTYSRPLYVNVELRIKETGEIQEQGVFMGDFPTDDGQGHVHHQRRRAGRGLPARALARRVLDLGEDPTTGRSLFSAKVIPNRGAWLEFETAARHVLYVKVDRKRKLEVTTLLRAVGYETNEEMVALFAKVDTGEVPYIASTSSATARTPARKRSSTSTRSCAPVTRPRVTTRRSWSRACSSTSAATTSAGWAATSSTRSWGPSRSAWASSSVDPADHQPRGHRGHRGPPHRPRQRPRPAGRHRPPRQPAHPRQRRAHPERLPGGPAAHGARGQGAHDDPGGGQGHPATR